MILKVYSNQIILIFCDYVFSTQYIMKMVTF